MDGECGHFFQIERGGKTPMILPYTLNYNSSLENPNGSLDADSERHYSLYQVSCVYGAGRTLPGRGRCPENGCEIFSS
jgi:hypothetical protein